MNYKVEEQRENLRKNAEEVYKKRYPDRYYSSYGFFDQDNSYCKDEIEVFKYLFTIKDDKINMFLWNDLYKSNGHCNKDEINLSDFSEEEKYFIYSVLDKYRENISKYGILSIDGFLYSEGTNINSFETSRLILCPWSDETHLKYTSFFENNINDYELYYGKDYYKSEVQNNCFGCYDRLGFSVLLKETKELIGSVALRLMRNDAVYNLEYFIFPEFRRKGYAFEAVSALIEKAKNNELLILEETVKCGFFEKVNPKIKSIEVKIAEYNTRSMGLIRKLGFKEICDIPLLQVLHGKYYNGKYFYYLIG